MEAPAHVFLRSLGLSEVPHGSRLPRPLPSLTSVVPTCIHPGATLWAGDDDLAKGSFLDHLISVEMVLRSWQAAEGADRYPETLCLAGSYHSIYGQRPRAKRRQPAGC